MHRRAFPIDWRFVYLGLPLHGSKCSLLHLILCLKACRRGYEKVAYRYSRAGTNFAVLLHYLTRPGGPKSASRIVRISGVPGTRLFRLAMLVG